MLTRKPSYKMYYMSEFCVGFVLNQEYYNSIESSLKELSNQDCKITIISEEKINTPFKNFVLKTYLSIYHLRMII